MKNTSLSSSSIGRRQPQQPNVSSSTSIVRREGGSSLRAGRALEQASGSRRPLPTKYSDKSLSNEFWISAMAYLGEQDMRSCQRVSRDFKKAVKVHLERSIREYFMKNETPSWFEHVFDYKKGELTRMSWSYPCNRARLCEFSRDESLNLSNQLKKKASRIAVYCEFNDRERAVQANSRNAQSKLENEEKLIVLKVVGAFLLLVLCMALYRVLVELCKELLDGYNCLLAAKDYSNLIPALGRALLPTQNRMYCNGLV